jgi:hypothetical protein
MTDRIEAHVERSAPGFRNRILARHVMGPADFERHNSNLVGGDLGGGEVNLRQLFTRPALQPLPYATRTRAFSSARPPRRPARASTACAATTRLGWRCDAASVRPSAKDRDERPAKIASTNRWAPARPAGTTRGMYLCGRRHCSWQTWPRFSPRPPRSVGTANSRQPASRKVLEVGVEEAVFAAIGWRAVAARTCEAAHR